MGKKIPIKVEKIVFSDGSELNDVICMLTDQFLVVTDETKEKCPDMYNLSAIRSMHGIAERQREIQRPRNSNIWAI